MVLFGQVEVGTILFVNFASAALQNVTVDDAVLTGTVVPNYLPSKFDWNQGNNCSTCNVHLDPSMVYAGTWHDATYYPGNSSITQAIEFTFTGTLGHPFNGYVPHAITFTNVEFVLDGTPVSLFTHKAPTGTDFEYNQTVYANSSIPYGQHTMLVMPMNVSADSNGVLMLFDYLIYTTNTNSEPLTTSAVTPSLGTAVTSSTSSGAPTTSSKLDVGAIVGGTVAGSAILLLLIASVLCYWRYKRRTRDRMPSPQIAAVDPFIPPSHMAPPGPAPAVTESGSRSKTWALPPAVPSSSQHGQPSTSTPPTTAVLSYDTQSHSTSEILGQVELLRDEVARLRSIRSWDWDELGSQPSEYS